MADNGNVGVISLDLIIKQKIGEQLEHIKRSVEGPASKVGEAIEKAISAPMEKAGKEVGKAVSEAVKSVDETVGDDVTEAIDRALQRMKEQEQALIDTANEKPRAVQMGNYVQYDSSGIMAEVEETTKKLYDKVTETVDKANKKLSEFRVDSEPAARLRQEIQLTTTQIDLLQKKWQELSSADPTDKVISQLNATEQKIISTQNKLDGLKAKLYELENGSPEIIPNDTAEKAEKAAVKTESSFKKAFSSIRSKASSAFSKIRSAGGNALSSLRNHFKSVGKSASSLIKPVSKLGTALKNTFRRVFLMAGIYAAFRAVKDGLLEAAKADEKFANSLNAVKANLAIAFQPILQAIMPALNTLMSGLAAVTKQVAGFIAGLFGSTYKQAAEATKKLKTTADAAKKAKMSMAGIDEMNVLSGGDESGADKDEGGVDYSKLDMSEPELPDWAEKLKESIKKGDWKGVGAILAERVNSAFSAINWDSISAKLNSGIGKLTDAINGFLERFTEVGGWETLGDNIAGGLNTVTSAVNKFYDSIDWSTLGSGIANGLNRAIETTNWEQLGKALSAKLRALIDTAFAFVTTFDFKGLGKGIGTAVNGWFDNIDFKKAGKTLSEGVKGAFDTAINFVQTVDWENIGEKIADFISNIDWAGIASRVFELLGSALGAAVSLLWGAVKKVVKSIGEFFTKEFEKMDTGNIGADIILGILVGISDAIIGIGKWIYNNIFKPFWNGIKKAFGIASPSKKMAEIGGYIIQGLFNAIKSGINAVIEVFVKLVSAIKEVFSDIGEWLGGKFSEALDNITAVWSGVKAFFSDIWEGIKAVFAAVGEWFAEKFRSAVDVIFAIWSAVTGFFSSIWENIKAVFSAVSEWFTEKFQSAWDNIAGIWSVVTGFFSEIWSEITAVFSGVGKWFSEKFEEAYKKVTNIWEAAKSFFAEIWDSIKQTFSKVGTWFKDKFKQAWDNVKTIWTLAEDFFQRVWNGIKEVFSKVNSWFKEKFQEAIDNVKTVWSGVTNFFSGLWDGITGVFSSVGTWFRDKFNEALENIKAVFSGIGEFFSGIWETIKDIFSSVGTSIGEAFSGAFKSVVNTVFEWIEDKVNGFIEMINGVIDLINEIPGVDLGPLDYIELPRLANGGLATAPTLAMVGDNRNAKTDPEVIAPLSKLQGMVGSDPEIVELLRMILELLRNGMNIEIINYLFRNSKEFSREVLNVVNMDKARSGK